MVLSVPLIRRARALSRVKGPVYGVARALAEYRTRYGDSVTYLELATALMRALGTLEKYPEPRPITLPPGGRPVPPPIRLPKPPMTSVSVAFVEAVRRTVERQTSTGKR